MKDPRREDRLRLPLRNSDFKFSLNNHLSDCPEILFLKYMKKNPQMLETIENMNLVYVQRAHILLSMK